MTGVVEGFRWALLGSQESAPTPMLAVSSLIAVLHPGDWFVLFPANGAAFRRYGLNYERSCNARG